MTRHPGMQADMNSRGNDHLQGLSVALKDEADGTVPTLPTRWLTAADTRLELGGISFESRYRGGAHTPGDTLVWLPDKSVLFTGDVTDVRTAKADMQAYLLALRAHMKKTVDDGIDVSAAVKSFNDQATPTQGKAPWTSRYSAPVVPTARTRSR